MKRFLKLLVSIIVIIVGSFIAYFLLSSMDSYNINDVSGDNNVESSGDTSYDNILNERYESSSGNKENTEDIENSIEVTQSGETFVESKSGNYINLNISGENIQNDQEYSEAEKVQIVDKINVIEGQNNSANVKSTQEDSLGLDVLGIENKDLFDAFDIKEMSVTVQVAGSMVYILPASDFVNNGQYHYDKEGNLILYISELMGVGGEIRYYFNNNDLVTIEKKIEEQIDINYENKDEILSRAKLIYNKYMIEN